MKRKIFNLCLAFLAFCSCSDEQIVDMRDYGIVPGTPENLSSKLQEALTSIHQKYNAEEVTLRFEPGTYHFHPEGAAEKVYYISNHDQPNPKKVGLALENWEALTLDGQGASFVFHGQMLPVSLIQSEACTLKNFSIDFENPHIAQVQIVKNDAEEGITFQPAPWVKSRINEKGYWETYGEGWTHVPQAGIAFNEETRHLLYQTSDLWCPTNGVKEVSARMFLAPDWKDKRLVPGTIVAMRTWQRPAPGIFLAENKDTRLENIKVHYAEGMGLLAQLCENITLEKFSVCLRDGTDPRYFTTQADATHFSGCKGMIRSCGGLYEGMMDDAINVHGTYLKIVKRVDNHTVHGQYMHGQSYGFRWGDAGDEVQFVRSATMELLDGKNKIAAIRPVDQPTEKGAKVFEIRFEQPLDASITEKEGFGIENLEWCPEVYFADNVIRNNRARGSLFSTPKKTLVERNVFDHTSGTAILLCGDCNGWFETGACRNVQIRHNKFINSLTNLFQFTEGIISIYPEIPNLKDQQKYFHGGEGQPGVVIEENEFHTFDRPLVYAKSIDGLVFRKNKVVQNEDFLPFHRNKVRFRFERVKNVQIADNDISDGDASIQED